MDHLLEFGFSETDLKMASASCRYSLAPRPDGIRNVTLAQFFVGALSNILGICISSLDSGLFPCDGKVVRVLLILKLDKSPLHMNPYRPIALSSSVGKVWRR